MSKRLATRSKAANLPAKVVPESARNTALATMVKAGVPLHVEQDVVGHDNKSSSDAVTLRYLGRTSVAQMAEAIAQLPGVTK